MTLRAGLAAPRFGEFGRIFVRVESKDLALLGPGLAGAVKGEDVLNQGRGELPQLRPSPPQHLACDSRSNTANDYTLNLRWRTRLARKLRGSGAQQSAVALQPFVVAEGDILPR